MCFYIIVFCCQCAAFVSACTTGWFGSSCQYKCHCTNNRCDDQGLCLAGSSCERGWFGPLCQYQDLALFGNISMQALADGNDSTCVNLRSCIINWPISYEVTSIRVKFQTKDPVSDIHLSVNETHSASSFTPCTNQTMSTVNDFTTDIYCNYSKTVQAVLIDFGNALSVCTVNFNGGRNVALKQPTWQSSNLTFEGVVYNSSKAVDGNTDGYFISTQSCTHTTKPDPLGTWRVTLPYATKINRYILYNRADCCQDRLREFTLTSYSSNNETLFTYTDPNPYTNSAVYTITSTSTPNVTYVQIQSKLEVLTLCEVEIFEGCPIGWFGPSCQYKCHCNNNYCDVSGGCYGGASCISGWAGPLCQYTCNATFYGYNCTSRCSTNCKDQLCDNVGGICVACIPGTKGDFCKQVCDNHQYGPNCLQNCSSNCEDSKCNITTGECYSCVVGFQGTFCNLSCDSQNFGPNCAYNCSLNCEKSECNKTTGECFACVAGFKGQLCDISCDKTHYGPGCIYNCSTHCDKSECDKANGRCYSCLPGYTGDFCNTPVETSTNGNNCYIDVRFNNCTNEYQAESFNHCQDRLAEGIGIGIGIMCGVVGLITAIACIIRKYVPSLTRETGNQNIVNGQTVDKGKVTESQTVYTDLDIPSSTVELNPYDTIQKESSPYDSLDTDYKGSVQYESAGL